MRLGTGLSKALEDLFGIWARDETKSASSTDSDSAKGATVANLSYTTWDLETKIAKILI